MQHRKPLPLRPPILPFLLLATLPACAGLGNLSDVLAAAGGLYGGDLVGEIRSVDTRRQEIQIESEWGGADWVRYDNRTEVIYRQRRYRVRDLERGDLVRIRVDEDRRGEPYASRIEVERSRDDRRSSRDSRVRAERLDGTVGHVDTRSGAFELYLSRGRALLVTLPYQPPRSVNDRFRRLRRGDRIRIEGEVVDQTRVELVRFL